MTQLGSEQIRTSRWTPRQRSSGTTGGTSGSTSMSLKLSKLHDDELRYEHFAFRLKSSFSPVVKTTSDGKQSVLTLRQMNGNFTSGHFTHRQSQIVVFIELLLLQLKIGSVLEDFVIITKNERKNSV